MPAGSGPVCSLSASLGGQGVARRRREVGSAWALKWEALVTCKEHEVAREQKYDRSRTIHMNRIDTHKLKQYIKLSRFTHCTLFTKKDATCFSSMESPPATGQGRSLVFDEEVLGTHRILKQLGCHTKSRGQQQSSCLMGSYYGLKTLLLLPHQWPKLHSSSQGK